MRTWPLKFSLLFAAALFAACGDLAVRPAAAPMRSLGEQPVADRVVFSAIQFVGVPYRFGGTSLRGVDCSGLVYLVYQNAGYAVPRTSVDQYRNAHPVGKRQLVPGDLLFFKLRSSQVSHVGIYLGEDRFIHAPRTGKEVSYSSLNDPFWNKRWVSAGRFYDLLPTEPAQDQKL